MEQNQPSEIVEESLAKETVSTQVPKKEEPRWILLLPWLLLIVLVAFVVVKKQSNTNLEKHTSLLKRQEPRYPALLERYQSLLIVALKDNSSPEWVADALTAQILAGCQEVPGLVLPLRHADFFKNLNNLSDNQTNKPDLLKMRQYFEVENLLYLNYSTQDKKHQLLGELMTRQGEPKILTVQSESLLDLVPGMLKQITEALSLAPVEWVIPKIFQDQDTLQFYGMSLYYWSLRSISRSYLEAKKIVEKFPQDPFVLNYLSQLEFFLQRKKTALSHLEQLLTLDPQNKEGLVTLGELYYEESMRKGLGTQERENYWQKAEQLLVQAVTLSPNLFHAYALLGKLFYAQKLEEFSYNAYVRAFKIYPTLDSAWYASEYLARQERIPEAIDIYRTLLQKNPEDAEGYLRLGYFLARQDAFEDAHQQLKKAEEFQAEPERIGHYRSFIYFFEGEMEKSIQELKTILQKNSRYNAANLTLGYLYKFFSNEPDHAYKYLKAYKDGGGTEASLDSWLEELKSQIQEKTPNIPNLPEIPKKTEEEK